MTTPEIDASTAPPTTSEPSIQQRFFRFFQHEITAIQEQIGRLAERPTVGGERADAAEHCLASITRLSGEVKDASSYLPAYDQRTYSEAVKALQERLQETKAAFAPRAKFSFKARKSPSAISLSDAAELAAQKRKAVPGYLSPSASNTPNPASLAATPPNEQQTSSGLQVPSSPSQAIRPSLSSQATSVNITSQTNAHLILPATSLSPGTPCMLSRLTSCVLDLIPPTTTNVDSHPFASLTITQTSSSLLLAGRVAGPTHVTNLSNSILVLATHQLRLHHCSNLTIYLHSTSSPIIEDCSNVQFTTLPKAYEGIMTGATASPNMYDQVDDFKHIKATPSPNWQVMKSEERVPEEIWRDAVPGGRGGSVSDILRAVRLQ